jgi:hypothetical protein
LPITCWFSCSPASSRSKSGHPFDDDRGRHQARRQRRHLVRYSRRSHHRGRIFAGDLRRQRLGYYSVNMFYWAKIACFAVVGLLSVGSAV